MSKLPWINLGLIFQFLVKKKKKDSSLYRKSINQCYYSNSITNTKNCLNKYGALTIQGKNSIIS